MFGFIAALARWRGGALARWRGSEFGIAAAVAV
jgi:hypothetical protein